MKKLNISGTVRTQLNIGASVAVTNQYRYEKVGVTEEGVEYRRIKITKYAPEVPDSDWEHFILYGSKELTKDLTNSIDAKLMKLYIYGRMIRKDVSKDSIQALKDMYHYVTGGSIDE